MKLIYLKPALKCDSFDIAIGIKIPFFRVLGTIEPGRSLLPFVTTNCLIIVSHIFMKFKKKIESLFCLWQESFVEDDIFKSFSKLC